MIDDKVIFLLGYMGSGKSTIGKILAASLERNFIDLDQYIEGQMGKNINALFDQYGEREFRNIESKLLRKISTQINNGVVALGGGTPCFNNNLEIINSTGGSVYIYCSIDELFTRLRSNSQDRPIIKELSTEQLHKRIKRDLRRRGKFYRQANVTVFNNTSPENLSKRIIRKLKALVSAS